MEFASSLASYHDHRPACVRLHSGAQPASMNVLDMLSMHREYSTNVFASCPNSWISFDEFAADTLPYHKTLHSESATLMEILDCVSSSNLAMHINTQEDLRYQYVKRPR